LERSIIHLNVADFAVAVERVADRRLKERPVIIAPERAGRAAVYDMSQEAYLAGVRKGMPLRRAAGLCRGAVILPPHPDRYEQAMQALLKQALPYSPMIEMAEGDGHLFVDATGTCRLFGPPMDVAWRLRRKAKTELGLDPIWSVASNKLVAKVVTRLVKPLGEYIVEAGEEQAVMAPLPIRLVPGIEYDDLIRLWEFNLTRVSDVIALSMEQLEMAFGAHARFIYEAIRGIDPSPVRPAGQKPPIVTATHEFGAGTNDRVTLEGVLYGLVEKAGSELRKRRLAVRRIRILLDYWDGIRHDRRAAVTPATANDLTLFESAKSLLLRVWKRRVCIRYMRLICDQLIFPPAQMELFDLDQEKTQKRADLVAAIDRIRDRFGRGAIGVGRSLSRLNDPVCAG
jgi:DNA polymerase-4